MDFESGNTLRHNTQCAQLQQVLAKFQNHGRVDSSDEFFGSGQQIKCSNYSPSLLNGMPGAALYLVRLGLFFAGQEKG